MNKAIATLKDSGKIEELQGKWFPGTEDRSKVFRVEAA